MGMVAWALAVGCVGDGPASVVVAAPCSVTADRSGRHDGAVPLAMPQLAEAEIAEADVDPTGVSQRSWPLPANGRRHADEHAAVPGNRGRGAVPDVLVANAADLSRLCRLLC